MHPSNHIAIFLATSGHSGVERVMGNLIRGIAIRGMRVDLIRIKGHGPFLGHFDNNSYNENIDSDIKEINSHLNKNLRVIDLPARHVASSLPYLIQYLRAYRPKTLLSDKDRVNRASLLAVRLSGVRTRNVFRIGTTVSANLKRRPFLHRTSQLLSIKYLYPFAKYILVPSIGAKEDIIQLAPLLKDKVKAVKSPVITDELLKMADEPVSHRWLNPKNSPIILGIGELCFRKDFETLIRAFAIVKKEGLDARLIILGKGRYLDRLNALSARLGLDDYIDIAGFVRNPMPFLKAADCFCLTSRCEGMPVALIEAMALGKTVVATNCPSGPYELLMGGKYGHLCPVGDYKMVAEAIKKAISSPLHPDIVREAVKGYSLHNAVEDYLRWID